MESAPRPKMMLNAASLAAATMVTSALGIVFWAIAARLFDAAGVGLANAQLSAATLLAAFGSLNLGGVLLLHLPRAGKYTLWMLRRSFVVLVVLSLAVALVYVLLGLGSAFLVDDLSIWIFIIGVPALAIFTEEDAALLAMGSGPGVTAKGTIFAITKILFLPLFAFTGVASGIFAAWILPTVLVVTGFGIYLMKKLGPRAMNDPVSIPMPPRKVLWPQIGKLYASYVANQITNLVIPLIVINRLGAAQNGYLTMAWLIGVSFGALIINVTQSFGQDVRKGHAITLHSLKRFAMLLAVIGIGGGAVVVICAPLILMILAPGYAPYSTEVLRCIGLAAPLQAVWLAMAVFLWLENRPGWQAAGNALVAAVAIPTTVILIPSMGITAAGIGLITGYGLLTIVSLPLLYVRYRHVKRGFGVDWALPEHVAPNFRDVAGRAPQLPPIQP